MLWDFNVPLDIKVSGMTMIWNYLEINIFKLNKNDYFLFLLSCIFADVNGYIT